MYFQAYTNTYAPIEILRERYGIVRKFDDIVGIAIGTRPDCVSEGVLDILESYTSDYEVWVEYGLQSIHEKTLKRVNRNHTYKDFLNAARLTRNRNIKICAHLIIGLPGETKNNIMATAREMGRLKLDGVKIHPLHVVKDTKLAELFKEGLYKALELDEFVEIATDFLGYLWPQTVIQRISADCPEELLIAPCWILEKNALLNKLDKRLAEKDVFQGKCYRKT